MASKESAVVGNTALDILEDNVERQEKFESFLNVPFGLSGK